MPTVHEFLSRLVTDVAARSAFEADPRGSLEQAGLGGMSNADVVQAVSLVFDHAPVEVVDGFVRNLKPVMEHFGSSQHVALNYPMPFFADGDNEMEHKSMPTPEIFSSSGDVDEMMRPTEENTTNNMETSEDTTGSNNPLGSGNEFQFDGLVGDISVDDISGVNNSGDVNAGNVAGNGVTDVVGGVEGGDVMGELGDVAGAGDVTGGLQDLGGVMPEVGGATNALPVDGMTELAPQGELMAPITGAEGPAGAVQNTAEDLTGGLVL